MAKMKLTNTKKREDFLNTFERWPIWVDVPEWGLIVRRFDLPTGHAVVVAQYASSCKRFDGRRWPHWQFLRPGEWFKSSYAYSINEIIGNLLALGHIEVDVPDNERAPAEEASPDQRRTVNNQ